MSYHCERVPFLIYEEVNITNFTKDKLNTLFLEAQKIHRGDKDISRKDWISFFENFDKFHTEALELMSLTFEDYLLAIHTKSNLKSTTLKNNTIVDLLDNNILTAKHIGILTNQSPHNVLNKAKRGREGKASIKINTEFGDSLDELNAKDTYIATLQALKNYINDDEQTDDKLRAIDSMLKHIEPQVIDELKRKYAVLNGLANFIISTVIPQTNNRLREMVRTIQEKINNKEDISTLEPDIRLIFKELLPSNQELYSSLIREGWVHDDNP